MKMKLYSSKFVCPINKNYPFNLIEMDNLKRLLDNLMYQLSDLSDSELSPDEDDFLSHMMLLRDISEREREEQFIRNLFSEFFEEENQTFEDIPVTLDEKKCEQLLTKCLNSDETNSKCTICLNDSTNDTKISLPCTHTFHKNCIKIWLTQYKVTCPVCRKDTREMCDTGKLS